MSVKMTRYKQADLADDDSSSIGTIQMNESTNRSILRIKYHTAKGTSLWHARSKLEKFLLLLTFLMIIVIICLVISISSKSNEGLTTKVFHVQSHSKVKQTPCLSEQCIFASSEILKSIDRNFDPCEDFYSFSCNQWTKRNPIPEGKSIWGAFGKLEQQNQLVIKNVLDKPESSLLSEAEKKAQLYYQSCLDEDEIMEKLGPEPMKKFLIDIGGWNITESGYNLNKLSFEKTLMQLQNKYNMGGLFSWAVGEDDRNSSRHIIQIDQGGLTLPTRDNYLNKTAHEKILIAYLDYMTKVGILLGGKENNVKPQMKEIIELETKLAEITTPSEDRRDEESLYNPMKLKELQHKAPFINWTVYFSDVFKQVNRKIDENETVVVYAPDYLKKLTKIITEYRKTSKGQIVLNNYLVWQGVRTLTAYLSKPFRDAYKGLRKALIGSDGGEELWRYCVADTSNVIGFAIGAMFVREVFHGESKPQAEEMINEVRTAFKKNLKLLKWMDSETCNLAEEKADAITDMIGFPDYILNSTLLDEKYNELKINSKEYFNNNLRINIYNLKKNLEKLDQLVNKTQWGMTPPTVNAYYTPTKNQIVFPAGILQLPFYDINNPKSLNFGAMGVVMGHELTHAFDDQGREYDKYGNLHHWWNNQTINKFKERANCFIKQYSSYKIKNNNLNGKQTLGENIADNGGLKAAFHAFSNSKIENEIDIRPLPGMNLTHKQLFFISFAQVWCSAITDEALTLQIEKDTHTPPQYRVIGTLSNLPEFAEEFKCPLGSQMNPINKCEVW